MTTVGTREMLEAIDGASWAFTAACHRSAAGRLIPRMLKDLLSVDPDVREAARLEALSSIWHQGTIYEATGYVAALLCDMLRVETPDVASDTAHLIALFSLSGRSAAEGRHAAGEQRDGERILEAVRTRRRELFSFIAEHPDADASICVLFALMQVPEATKEVLASTFANPRLRDVAQRLAVASLDDAWDLWESI